MRAPSSGPSRAFRRVGGAPGADEGTRAAPVRPPPGQGPAPPPAAYGTTCAPTPPPRGPGDASPPKLKPAGASFLWRPRLRLVLPARSTVRQDPLRAGAGSGGHTARS
ncbi:unnamed protein product [Rangifer tarandus platyrhynchus]|uniref:Uncharacterized protein n=2 Tax=Rangifer tarandus platyrhynchus TaxID=3082113 RepID=A0ABN8Y4T2_RANTA|nr:unnamed protein product [Rangifer tarandus platyrhynchus]CAI9693062.1 unnamed protein product [Rangifer tarandus platyrhynchus]